MNKSEERVYSPKVARMREKQDLKGISDFKASSLAEAEILKAGFEPWNLPEVGFLGAVEPISWWSVVKRAAYYSIGGLPACLAICVLMAIMVGAFPLRSGVVEFFAFLVLIGMGIGAFFCGAAGAIGVVFMWSQDEVEEQIVKMYGKNGLPSGTKNRDFMEMSVSTKYVPMSVQRGKVNYRVYTGGFPVDVWRRYKDAKARKLFDQMVIYAPKEDPFMTMEPKLFGKIGFLSLAALDPILVGVKDGKFYQGGVWDLELPDGVGDE